MTSIPLTPRIIFTNDLLIVSAFEQAGTFTDFNITATRTASEKNSIYLSTVNDNILNLNFNLVGATTDSTGPNITLDILDPKDEFENLIFSRRVSQSARNDHYYLAFGTDAEFANWSNILKVKLVHAELFNSFEQPKTIRLHLFAAVRIDTLNIDVFNGYTKDIKEFGDSLEINGIEPLKTYNEDELGPKGSLRQRRVDTASRFLKNIDLDRVKKDLSEAIRITRGTLAQLQRSKRALEDSQSDLESLESQRDRINRSIDQFRANPPLGRQTRLFKLQRDLRETNQSIEKKKSEISAKQNQVSKDTEILAKAQTRENELSSKIFGGTPYTIPQEKLDELKELLDADAIENNIITFNSPEFDKELKKIIYGYDTFDFCFKKIINNLLKNLYSNDTTTLFLIQDTEKILYSNSNTKLLILSLREALKNTVSIDLTSGENINIPADPARGSPARVSPTIISKVNFSNENLEKYKKYIENSLNVLLPSYLTINIVNEIKVPTTTYYQNTTGDPANLGVTFAEIQAPTSPFFQEYFEEREPQILTLSLKIPRRAGETDDSFKTKISDFFIQLERGLSIVDKDGFEDNLILISESDTTIINNFYDFLNQSEAGKEIIKDFNIKKNKPLVILGQYTIIRAMIYGETYINTETSIVNTITKDYFKDLVIPKLKDKSFNMYGQQNNLLTNLEKLLESNKIQNQNFINNVKNITDDLIIFKHNIENPNVLSIKVDDYKAYTKYLLVNTTEPETKVDEVSDKVVVNFIRASLRSLDGPLQYKIDNFIDYIINDTEFRRSELYKEILKTTDDVNDFTQRSRFSLTDSRPRPTLQNIGQNLDDINYLFKQNSYSLTKDYVSLIKNAFDLYDRNQEYLKYAFAFSRDTALQYEQIYRGLQVATFRVTIKTLPLFFISNYGFFRKNCLLLSKRVNLINTLSNLDNVVTGGYEIIGIKHRISNNNAESEFILQRLK